MIGVDYGTKKDKPRWSASKLSLWIPRLLWHRRPGTLDGWEWYRPPKNLAPL